MATNPREGILLICDSEERAEKLKRSLRRFPIKTLKFVIPVSTTNAELTELTTKKYFRVFLDFDFTEQTRGAVCSYNIDHLVVFTTNLKRKKSIEEDLASFNFPFSSSVVGINIHESENSIDEMDGEFVHRDLESLSVILKKFPIKNNSKSSDALKIKPIITSNNSPEIRSDLALQNELFEKWEFYNGEEGKKKLQEDMKKYDPSSASLLINRHGGYLLEYASEEVKNCRPVLLLAVNRNGNSLQFTPSFQRDLEIVQLAVCTNGEALQYVCQDFRGNKDLVMKAVSNNGEALQFASEELKSDKEIVKKACSINGTALQYANEELRKDYDVLIRAFSSDIGSVHFANEEGIKTVLVRCIDTLVNSASSEKFGSILKDKEIIEKLESLTTLIKTESNFPHDVALVEEAPNELPTNLIDQTINQSNE